MKQVLLFWPNKMTLIGLTLKGVSLPDAATAGVRSAVTGIAATPSGGLYCLDSAGRLWSFGLVVAERSASWASWSQRELVADLSPEMLLLGATEDFVYLRAEDGELYRLGRPVASTTAPGAISAGLLNHLGSGWDAFRHLFPASDREMLAVDEEGWLHRIPLTGSSRCPRDAAIRVSGNWNRFCSLIGSGRVLYALGPTGEMLQFSLVDGRSVRARPPPVGLPLNVAGWFAFHRLASYGEDYIIALGRDGRIVLFSVREMRHRTPTVLACSAEFVGTAWPTGLLEAYCWPMSVQGNEPIAFYVSCPSGCEVEFVDLVAERAVDVDGLSMHERQLPPFEQSTPPDADTDGCGWRESLSITVPGTWASGLYAAKFTSGEQRFYANFVVRPGAASPSRAVVALASTNTWNAYNPWGAASKYGPRIGRQLSFLRPNPAACPEWDGRINHLVAADLWILRWMHDVGLQPDVETDWDLHYSVDWLDSYKVIILLTHPEYWTHQMRDHLEAYIQSGGTVIYLGGNGLFEVCTFCPDGKALSFLENCTGVERCGAFFRNAHPPRPERAILGVAFRFDVDWKADPLTHTAEPYRVMNAGHKLFDGTGVVAGNLIGTEGRNGGAACGWEMDTCLAGLTSDGLVDAKGESDRGCPPDGLTILARGASFGSQYTADMTYYETGVGGAVFAAGSICFGGSLVEDAVLQSVVRKAIMSALEQSRRVEGDV